MDETAKTALANKVQRINILQRLLTQDRVNLTAKDLGDLAILTLVNDDVKDFLVKLLNKELGSAPSSDVLGLNLTPERVVVLNAFIDKLMARTSVSPLPVLPNAAPVAVPVQPAEPVSPSPQTWQQESINLSPSDMGLPSEADLRSLVMPGSARQPTRKPPTPLSDAIREMYGPDGLKNMTPAERQRAIQQVQESLRR